MSIVQYLPERIEVYSLWYCGSEFAVLLCNMRYYGGFQSVFRESGHAYFKMIIRPTYERYSATGEFSYLAPLTN